MYYPNQKQITIRRDIVQNSKKEKMPYLIAYQQNLEDAMQCLSPTTFKVYICLLCNKDYHTLEYSPEHISKVAGICKDSARKALKQLEQEGYLEQVKEHQYVFRESKLLPFSTQKKNYF